MKAQQADNVALFDMDETLCDYSGQLSKDMRKLMSPGEKEFDGNLTNAPEHIQKRADMIKSQQEWWENLPRLQLGFDLLKEAQNMGYRIMILTQGPTRYPAAWAGKKVWIEKNVGSDVDITITRDKSLVYGKVLVDDWLPYVENWLKWRKNGLAVMPGNELNANLSLPNNVIRYDGTNIEQVRFAMEVQFARRPGQDFEELFRRETEVRKISKIRQT